MDIVLNGINLIKLLKNPIIVILFCFYIIFNNINNNEIVKEEINKKEQEWNNVLQQTSENVTKCANMFLYDKKDGIDCWVGISKALKDSEASIFFSNKNLKLDDIFYLTNEKDFKYCPTIRFKVERIDRTDPSVSRASIFISYEAALLLQIPEDKIKEGIFPMKIHYIRVPELK